MGVISSTFVNGIREIREFEKSVAVHSDFFRDNMDAVRTGVEQVIGSQK